jgi:prepilin-type N-terminal cleavage/methylation domain-containing protein
MKKDSFKLNNGFTLVELIVVIAIVAILTAVIIPSFTKYIDRSRFSNDTQNAASMTKILDGYFVAGSDEELDGYDVQMIINEYHGSSYDFTPQSSNTGFFYLANSRKIVAAKYEDAEDLIDSDELSMSPMLTQLLADYHLDGEDEFASPEELFGSGKHLLTREGSPIALAVALIYSLASSGSIQKAVYERGSDTFDNYADSLIARILGIGISEELKNHVSGMLEYYDPSETLYVNDITWMTAATQGSDIKRVVFAPGIATIPSFDVTLSDNIAIESIKLPKTVRTVYSDAFNAFSSLDEGDIIISSTSEINILGDSSGLEDKFTKAVGSIAENLIDVSGLITYDTDTEPLDIQLDLRPLLDYLLGIGVKVTAYRIDVNISDFSESRVHIYTVDGYYGYVIPEPLQE